jgi:mitogen-activated protein kinase kinase 1
MTIGPDGIVVKDVQGNPRTSKQRRVMRGEDIEFLGAIGRGNGGVVQRAIHLPTSTTLAVKLVNIYDRDRRLQLLEEIRALFNSDCPCLVKFYGAFFHKTRLCICLEFMDKGSLCDVMKHGKVPEQVLAAMAYQMLWGLAYLRFEKRFHRDIKPANVLVDSSGAVKLSDFGVSREMGTMSMAKTWVGTFKYMAPERIESKPYDAASDIWSLGIVLIECATSEFPYMAGSVIEMVQCIRDSEPTIRGDFSSEFRSFMRGCMQKDPARRSTADELLASPWLQMHGAVSVGTATEIVAGWLASREH